MPSCVDNTVFLKSFTVPVFFQSVEHVICYCLFWWQVLQKYASDFVFNGSPLSVHKTTGTLEHFFVLCRFKLQMLGMILSLTMLDNYNYA